MDTAPLSLPKTDTNACTPQILPTSTIGLTIFVTCYNLEHYIRKTLASVFAQNYKGPMEVIIVDDCSRDDSWNEIQKAVGELGQGWDITLIRNEENRGVTESTYTAWKKAKYEWLVEVDGDDIQLPDRCSKVADVIRQHPDAGMIIFSAQRMGADDDIRDDYATYSLNPCDTIPDELWLDTPERRFRNRFDDELVLQRIYGFGATSCFRRSVFQQWGAIPDYGSGRLITQDTVWAWRYMASAPVYASKHISCYYRSHSGNIYNARKQYDYRGYMQQELMEARRSEREWHTVSAIVRDVERAIAEPGLSLWNTEQLQEARAIFLKELPNLELRSTWWKLPWHQRLAQAFHFRNKVNPSMKYWAWSRLLPLPVTAFLRWFLKEKLRKH